MKELEEVLENAKKFEGGGRVLTPNEVLELQNLVEVGAAKLQEKNKISYAEIMASAGKGSKYILGTVLGGDKMRDDLIAGFRMKMKEVRK